MSRFRGSTSTAEKFEGLRSDYNAAKTSRWRRRRSGTLSVGSHADWHYRVETDYLKIMEQARDMDRNDMICGQTVNRAVDNEIGCGMTPSPTPAIRALTAN